MTYDLSRFQNDVVEKLSRGQRQDYLEPIALLQKLRPILAEYTGCPIYLEPRTFIPSQGKEEVYTGFDLSVILPDAEKSKNSILKLSFASCIVSYPIYVEIFPEHYDAYHFDVHSFQDLVTSILGLFDRPDFNNHLNALRILSYGMAYCDDL